MNKKNILSKPNLIIDIRNGTGGSDGAYSEILPLIYTNPIRTPGVEYLSTPLNNKRMLDFATDSGEMVTKFHLNFTEEEKNEFKSQYETLSLHLGEFVNLNSASTTVTTFDKIYPYPKNVGIIHNEKNGSADEQFLLAAKQSKKVKLFGTKTFGELDVSNVNMVYSPCKDYILYYTLTKSKRIPKMAIDGIGIQPDYYLDEEIPDHEWVNYVTKILNGK